MQVHFFKCLIVYFNGISGGESAAYISALTTIAKIKLQTKSKFHFEVVTIIVPQVMI
jgi:hypothetical protein